MTNLNGNNRAADALRAAAAAAKATSDASQAQKPSENEGLTLDQIKDRAYKRAVNDTMIGRMGKEAYESYTFVKRAYDTSDVVWNTYLKPVSYFLNPLLNLYWKGCKNIFNRVSFDSEGNYNKNRAAAAVLALTAVSGVFAWQAATHAVPVTMSVASHTLSFGYDAVAVNFFSHQDTMVFSKADPISTDGEPLFSVFACSKSPCEAQFDSTEFRIRDSDYLDVVSFFENFQPHDPGELAGGFLSEENACKVEYFGGRNKYMGWYPHIISATCVSINGDMSAEEALVLVNGIDADQPEQIAPNFPGP